MSNLPSGWIAVPIEPTSDMVIAGFESVPDRHFDGADYPAEYDEMSGCEQAAFRAKRCYAAMLSAVPALPPQTPIGVELTATTEHYTGVEGNPAGGAQEGPTNLAIKAGASFSEAGNCWLFNEDDLVRFAALAQQPANTAPAEPESTANTMAGFVAGHRSRHGKQPTDQDIWNAGVRSGLRRTAPAVQAVRDQVLEEAALLIDLGQETITSVGDGVENVRTLTARKHGNLAGLAYADAIRALKTDKFHLASGQESADTRVEDKP